MNIYMFFLPLIYSVPIQDTIGRYYCVGLKRANEIIGTTTEELVLKAKQGAVSSWCYLYARWLASSYPFFPSFWLVRKKLNTTRGGVVFYSLPILDAASFLGFRCHIHCWKCWYGNEHSRKLMFGFNFTNCHHDSSRSRTIKNVSYNSVNI